MTRTLKRRFHEKVTINHVTDCWLWTGAQDGHGYGQINVNGRPEKAHRLAYRIYNGEIPHGLCLDHLCRVQHCMNPEHLEAVTLAENTRRQLAVIGHPRANKTHCPHGHPYDEANTRFAVRGRVRVCRICRAASSKSYRDRKNHG